MGAQLGWAVGATTGGVILPGIGVVIGALAGWFANNLLGFAFPSCDGPVAVGLYIYNGVQLRELTKNGTYTRTDNNPGVDSAAGCGQNSDYDVTWSLSKL